MACAYAATSEQRANCCGTRCDKERVFHAYAFRCDDDVWQTIAEAAAAAGRAYKGGFGSTAAESVSVERSSDAIRQPIERRSAACDIDPAQAYIGIGDIDVQALIFPKETQICLIERTDEIPSRRAFVRQRDRRN